MVNASALPFDSSHPEVRSAAQRLGWNRPGLKVSVPSADLVYTTDHWKTTRTAPIQYLYNYRQGFLLWGVPIGTTVEYAVHAKLAMSRDNFRSYDDRADVWINNGGYGKNYLGVTKDPTRN